MKREFKGDLDELKGILAVSGIEGHWVDQGEFHHFLAEEGESLNNWWPETGLQTIEGSPSDAKSMAASLDPILQEFGKTR